MAQALDEARFAEAPPEIEVRRVGLLRPLAWLAAGMSDLRRRPGRADRHRRCRRAGTE